jgi:hypothetical protein
VPPVPEEGLNVKLGGQGGSYTIQRTFEVNAETKASLEAGTAVVVVHGLDPATLSPAAQEAKSDLTPDLPLAATSPALCGTLVASQMGAMPNGGADTEPPRRPDPTSAPSPSAVASSWPQQQAEPTWSAAAAPTRPKHHKAESSTSTIRRRAGLS